MKIYYSEASKSSIVTVSALNEYVKDLLEDDPELVYCEVEGEISNFKHYLSSGHMYFTLKDEGGAIAAVMYRAYTGNLTFLPKDGMKVTVRGSVTLYPKNGSYQILVREMKKSGEGDLFVAFEELKRKLHAEGLFEDENKKKIPQFPKKVGIITSKFGAALQDMLNISKRRYPLAEILVYPSLVQGPGAAEALVRAVDYFDRNNAADVVIIGRGGGSIEDLWCFNDEVLARRIFECKIPVVSAVGHETDYTICDFVADKRASTPSEAAELVFPDGFEILQSLAYVHDDLSDRINSVISDMESKLAHFTPEKISLNLSRRVSDTERRLFELRKMLSLSVNRKATAAEDKLAGKIALLEAASPLKILTKGYSVVTDSEGIAVKDSSSLSHGDEVSIRFSKGSAKAKVSKVEE